LEALAGVDEAYRQSDLATVVCACFSRVNMKDCVQLLCHR
jgi:hypothetical protein